MSVRKFRRVEDIPQNWLEPGSAALSRVVASLWAFGQRTLGARFPPGVHKHRSIESLLALEEDWDRQNFEALQARRAALR